MVIACLIDVARLSVYAGHFSRAGLIENAGLLGLACQRAVVAGLVLIAVALGAGLI